MRIGLVTDIPDQPVMRRLEDVMQRHRQLDHSEPRAEMTASDRDGVDQLGAQLFSNLPQVGFGQPPQIGRDSDPIEERRPVGDVARLLIQDGAPHARRSTTNRATCRKSSALGSNKSRWATAWSTNSPAWARARSIPRIETKVAFPAAASAPT